MVDEWCMNNCWMTCLNNCMLQARTTPKTAILSYIYGFKTLREVDRSTCVSLSRCEGVGYFGRELLGIGLLEVTKISLWALSRVAYRKHIMIFWLTQSSQSLDGILKNFAAAYHSNVIPSPLYREQPKSIRWSRRDAEEMNGKLVSI